MAKPDLLPTEDELVRVRTFECEYVNGHVLDIMVKDGEPKGVTCLHCDRKWPVFSPRSQKNRGAR